MVTKLVVVAHVQISLGMRRHFSHPPSQEEHSNNEPTDGNTNVISFDLTDESNKSLRTPLKVTVVTSSKFTSPSPRKRTCKLTARKSAQSPEWTPASPIQTPCVASPRRKRGGELSKEFMVRLSKIIKICIFIYD